MYGKKMLHWMVVLLIAVAVVGTSVPAVFAQDGGDDDAPPAEDEVLIGYVSFDDEGDLMVADVYVAPSGVFNPSDLDEGDLVLVEGYYLNETTFKATGFEMLEAAPDEECADGEDECDEAGDDDEDDGSDEGDDDDDDVGEDEDTGACGDNEHPVLTRLADEFGDALGVDYEVLSDLHCDGNGIGNLAKLLLIAEAAEVGFSVVLEMYLDGMNTNQIARELDVKITGVGHASNGRPRGGDDDSNNAPGNSGDAPGHDDDGPGNSENAPGHGGDNPGNGNGNNKDKNKDKKDKKDK